MDGGRDIPGYRDAIASKKSREGITDQPKNSWSDITDDVDGANPNGK